MQHFGNPRHIQSKIAYMVLTEYFCKIPVKNCIVGILLECPIGNIPALSLYINVIKMTHIVCVYCIIFPTTSQ